MVRFSVLFATMFAAVALAQNGTQPGQAAKKIEGARNVGRGDGSQFITGTCVNNADCAAGCCAGKNNNGVCSAEGAQFEGGKTGCGFSDPNAEQTIAAARAQVAQAGF
ncbi:hypothetical protein B0T11DRAFT_343685 [Plectosphaerella cucumerina]|uniref:Biotrophy-associated secreted protein 2 n=1 Tax=Plectosphaerella cucumerina TaxID=40658 RepID=A0A8K0WZ44_9PEZI|nr:hypothetical protein B0T11DRAFT_343685 [Plectosphaerella cucumerina]